MHPRDRVFGYTFAQKSTADQYSRSIMRRCAFEMGYNARMSRKVVAGGCALIAAALAVCGVMSYAMTLSYKLVCSQHDILLLHFYDGRVRLFWFHSPAEPFRVEEEYHSVLFVSSPTGEFGPWDAELSGPPPPPKFRFPINIGDRRQSPPIGGKWRNRLGPRLRSPFDVTESPWIVESSYLRLPVWSLVIALIILPIRDSIRERRLLRRKNRNECLECGYNLTGNISGQCPECGKPIPQSTPGVDRR